MLALNFIRENPELVRRGALRKGEEAPIDEILELDRRHRQLVGEEEAARGEMNTRSANLDPARVEAVRAQLGQLKGRIQQLQDDRRLVQERLGDLLLRVPNLPHDSVPDGTSDQDNLVVRTWGDPPQFEFAPRTHYDLGEALGIFDFERAVKVAGSRFAVLRGEGARLERGLAQLMLDIATRERGYTEISPPYLVTRD